MKRILLALLFCNASLMYGAGTRNMIMLLDWQKETVKNEFSVSQYNGVSTEYFGVITQGLMAALYQQAAPILVSSQTWSNLVGRGRIFADVISGKDMSYLQTYPLFTNREVLVDFINRLTSHYDPKADLILQYIVKKDAQNRVVLDANKNPVLISASTNVLIYYMAYQLFFSKDPFFKPHQWVAKKVSDYLYLLIPQSYKEAVRSRNDMTEEAPQVNLPFTADELLVGMKYDKFPTIPATILLDWQAHAQQFNVQNYQQLVPKHSYSVVEQLAQNKWYEILNGFLFGQHVVHVLPQMLINRSDLKIAKMNTDDLDKIETKFLHEWLVYLHGHGSPSDDTKLMPVVYQTGDGYSTYTRAGIAYTAGMEQNAFRDLLGFFNTRVNTGSLFYTSCYSGGPHLFKLLEHNWDYPKTEGQRIKKGQQAPKEVKAAQDVFNYLIIAANQFFTVTLTSTFAFWTNDQNYWLRFPVRYSTDGGNKKDKPQGLEFGNYFKSMASFLHPKPVAQKLNVNPKQRKLKGLSTQAAELIQAISYVHQFDFSREYMIPAVRFPYTEWFVPLNDIGLELQRAEVAEITAYQQKVANLESELYFADNEKIRQQKTKELSELRKKGTGFLRADRRKKEAERQLFIESALKKGISQKVKASIQGGPNEPVGVYEKQKPVAGQQGTIWKKTSDVDGEQASKAKKLQEAQEKERKEKELFDRMEAMRKEQAAREKEAREKAAQLAAQQAAQKPKPNVPTQPQKPTVQVGQPQKPTGQAGKPQIPAQAAKPTQPQQPVTPQVKPQQPLQPLPTQPTVPPVTHTGFKPIDISKLPPPPVLPIQVQQTGQSKLTQALKQLERSLYYMVDALLLDENGQ